MVMEFPSKLMGFILLLIYTMIPSTCLSNERDLDKRALYRIYFSFCIGYDFVIDSPVLWGSSRKKRLNRSSLFLVLAMVT